METLLTVGREGAPGWFAVGPLLATGRTIRNLALARDAGHQPVRAVSLSRWTVTLGALTEQRNPKTAEIDLASALEIVDLINAEDRTVAAAGHAQR